MSTRNYELGRAEGLADGNTGRTLIHQGEAPDDWWRGYLAGQAESRQESDQ